MIVVFGSINVDLAAFVAAPPRAGETVLSTHERIAPGGKGANQALAAARAGARVALYGSVGSDPFADLALAALRADGVDLGGVARRGGATGLAMICVARSGQNRIVVASGVNRESQADQLPDRVLGPGSLLLLQQEVPADANRELVRRARRAGATVLLNAAPARDVPRDTMAALDVLVTNEPEAETLAASLGMPRGDLRDTARALARAFDLTAVVTLGPGGAIAAAPAASWAVAALPVDAVDATGAGDAFTGIFAAALESGADLPHALRRASVGAGLACAVPGAQPGLPRDADIERRLEDLPPAARI